MAIRHQKILPCDSYQELKFSPDCYIAALIVESEQFVSYLTNSKSQIFDPDIFLRTGKRKAAFKVYGDFFCSLLMANTQLIDEIWRTHELHPAVELLVEKASERMLFGSPQRETSMTNSEWLGWCDTMNGCISAVRKHSKIAAFKKVQTSFEAKARDDYTSLKNQLTNQLKAKGSLWHISFDLIYPSTKNNQVNQIKLEFDHLHGYLATLLLYLSEMPSRGVTSSAWAISRNLNGSYRIQVSTFFSSVQPQVDTGSLIENIKSAWTDISKIGLVYFKENYSNGRNCFESAQLYLWASPESKKNLKTIAFYMVMPATYNRLKLEGDRKFWGTHCR